MKTANLFLSLSLMFFFCESLHAQVTIGGLENPKAGAILDLNSTTKGGLVLSNVTITNPEEIPQEANVFAGVVSVDVNMDLRGIMVYNDGQGTSVPAGIYIWNGFCWTKDGGITVVTVPSISIEGTVTNTYSIIAGGSVTFAVVSPQADVSYTWYNVADPSTSVSTGNTCITPALSAGTYNYYCTATSNLCPSSNVNSGLLTVTVDIPYLLPVGAGLLAGRACFDVAQTNDGEGYGLLSVRQLTTLPVPVLRADFTQEETNTQTYTFTPSSGGVSNLRFHVVEAAAYDGEIIESLYYKRILETQNNITETQDITIVYKNLNGTATGKDVSNALKVDIYAVYNSKPDGSGIVQTAKLTASIRDCACCGAFVDRGQWLNFMCHNLGADESADPFTPAAPIHGAKYKWGVKNFALSQDEDQIQADNNGYTETEWMAKGGVPPTDVDVPWNMETANPCPAGWRVPTENEWDNVLNKSYNTLNYLGTKEANESVGTNFSYGLQVGDALVLPAPGYRRYTGPGSWGIGRLYFRGSGGHYWSSTAYGEHSRLCGFNNHFSFTYAVHTPFRSYGASVRCVAD